MANKDKNEARKYDQKELKRFVEQVFSTLGVPEEDADIISDSLVEANLRGIDSHGVIRVPIYAKRYKKGLINRKPELKVERDNGSTILLNGDNGIGQVVGKRAMKIAVARAKDHGVSLIGVKNSNHFGIGGYFSTMALEENMIGMAISNGPPNMAPWGARESYLGTNPLSIAIPTGDEPAIVIDMATSVVARGKIIAAAKEGEDIEEGWAIDQEGRPTTDVEDALRGAVLPMAGAKGYCIALLIDILCGVLTGPLFGKRVGSLYRDFDRPQQHGHFFGAVKLTDFMNLDEYKSRIQMEIEGIRKLPTAEGFDEVLLPGDIERRTKAKRLKTGIPLSKEVVESLSELAGDLQIKFNF